jgi:methyl-accepting chemotaxis protein
MSQFLIPSISVIKDFRIQTKQQELERQIRLLTIYCGIVQFSYVPGVIILFILGLVTGQSGYFVGSAIYCGAVFAYAVAFWLARREKVVGARRLLIAVNLWLIFFSYWLLGLTSVMVVFQVAVIAFVLTLLKFRETATVAAASIGLGIVTYSSHIYAGLLQPLLKLETEIANFLNLTLLIFAVPVVLALIVLPAREQLYTLRQQTERLTLALGEIENRQNLGQSVSREVLELSHNLTDSAGQLADGNHQQLTSVTQVKASVAELSATADNIAHLTENVNEAANRVALENRIIEQTTLLSVKRSEEGQLAARQSAHISSEVAALYQQLLNSMQDLQKRSANMRLVLKLIEDIAEETHLLALNATIEAAGAGIHGERFGVVAQEVKTLARRCSEAGKQVISIITEVENASQSAYQMAQEGFGRAGQLENSAGHISQIIEQMRYVADQSQAQSSSISRVANEVKELSFVIRGATAQQRSASQQVLEALDVLNDIAGQNAQSSKTVETTALRLSNLSENLSTTLQLGDRG